MKKLIGTFIFLLCVQSSSAQFVHLDVNEESTEQSLI